MLGRFTTASGWERLLRRSPRWRVLHSVPLRDARGAVRGDIDHVLIGPPGVVTINTKHHPPRHRHGRRGPRCRQRPSTATSQRHVRRPTGPAHSSPPHWPPTGTLISQHHWPSDHARSSSAPAVAPRLPRGSTPCSRSPPFKPAAPAGTARSEPSAEPARRPILVGLGRRASASPPGPV